MGEVMIYAAEEKNDAVHQGRMIILLVGAIYLSLWLFEFFTFPIPLVPGFLYDRSLVTLETLTVMLVQFWTLGVGLVLLWAGFGWARYVAGLFLVVAGLYNVVFSVMAGSGADVQLLLGAMGVASGAALLLSMNVEKYAEDRNRRGVPWLGLGLSLAGLLTIFMGAIGVDLARVARLMAVDRQETAFAADALGKLIPALDPTALDPLASDKFKQDEAASDLAGQFAAVKQQLGAFRDWPGLPPPSVRSVVMNPERHGEVVAFNTVVHYEKANLMLELEVNAAQQPMEVVAVYFEKLAVRKAGK